MKPFGEEVPSRRAPEMKNLRSGGIPGRRCFKATIQVSDFVGATGPPQPGTFPACLEGGPRPSRLKPALATDCTFPNILRGKTLRPMHQGAGGVENRDDYRRAGPHHGIAPCPPSSSS